MLQTGADTDFAGRLYGALRTVFALAIPLSAIGYVVGIPRLAGAAIYDEQFLSLLLGLCLALAFLARTGRGDVRRGSVPWYDVAAAAVSLTVCLYMAWDYEEISLSSAMRPGAFFIPAVALILLLLESVRRVAGLALSLIVAAFIAYGLWGQMLPSPLTGRDLTTERLAIQIAFDPSAILGTALFICATTVVAFILFGAFLERSGGSDFFNRLALALFGGYRGGPAKIAVASSAFMGSISGSAVANVVSSGVITIPLMKRSGYSAQTAGAIEAVASTGGQLAPPVMGAAAFLIADFLQIDYSQVVISALIPAVLYYASIFFQVDLSAASQGLRAVARSELPSIRSVLKKGYLYILPFVVLIYSMFGLKLRVEEAALYATLSQLPLLLWHLGLKMSPKGAFDALVETGRQSFSVILIAAAAGIIIGILNLTGLSFNLTRILASLGGHSLFLLLLLSAILSIVLGMGMPTVGVYVLLATLVTPSIISLGVEPIAAHLFVMYYGMMSMITPPVAVAAFSAASLASSPPMRTAAAATAMAWTAFVVPFLFVYSPSLVGIGSPVAIVLSSVTALAGVWCITAAGIGYIRSPANVIERVAILAAGIALLLPPDLFSGAAWVNVAGGCLVGVMLLRAPSRENARQAGGTVR